MCQRRDLEYLVIPAYQMNSSGICLTSYISLFTGRAQSPFVAVIDEIELANHGHSPCMLSLVRHKIHSWVAYKLNIYILKDIWCYFMDSLPPTQSIIAQLEHRVGVRVVAKRSPRWRRMRQCWDLWIKDWEAGAYWRHTQLWDVPMLARETNKEREDAWATSKYDRRYIWNGLGATSPKFRMELPDLVKKCVRSIWFSRISVFLQCPPSSVSGIIQSVLPYTSTHIIRLFYNTSLRKISSVQCFSNKSTVPKT